jgi:sugar O-acyltransferase (sialic acid O-acetyltransferase NeuD family)
MKKKILIFGSGGHAKVVIDIIEKQDNYSIAGFVDTVRIKNTIVMGYSVLGDESTLKEIVLRYKIYGGVIAIGDNSIRSNVNEKIINILPGFEFVNCVHPKSTIGKDVKFGKGNVVMAGAIINASSIIKNHCIINTRSNIEHDCMMSSFSSIAPNATIGGNVQVGDYSAIGIGANVFNNVTIGKNCIIGGGSLVCSDTIENSIYYGSPSKFVRNHNFGDRYL